MPAQTPDSQHHHGISAWRYWLAFLVLSAVALFFLWEEHAAHIRGALPYLLIFACPLMHVFMHGGHSHHHSQKDRHPSNGTHHEP